MSPKRKACRYRTAESTIHGRGVFARVALKRGERVGVITGKVIGRTRSRKESRLYAIGLQKGVLVPQGKPKGLKGKPKGLKGKPKGLWLLNHSCRANALLVIKERSVEVIALRSIRGGQEITCDYRPSYHEGRLQCRCGAKTCDGAI